MNYLEWIVAGALSAILLLLAAAAHFGAKNSNRLANFAMVLLLDEFVYRRRRDEFLKLIESMNVEDAAVLYHAVMFELDDVAEKNTSRAGALAGRMLQLNREAIRTGRSATEAGRDRPDAVELASNDLGGATGFYRPPHTPLNTDEEKPVLEDHRAEHIAVSRAAVKVRRTVSKARRRLLNFLLGIK